MNALPQYDASGFRYVPLTTPSSLDTFDVPVADDLNGSRMSSLRMFRYSVWDLLRPRVLAALGSPGGFQPTLSNIVGTVNHLTGRSVLLWAIAPESDADAIPADTNHSNPSDPSDVQNENEVESDDEDSDQFIGSFKVALGWFVHEHSNALRFVHTRQAVTLTSDLDDSSEGTSAFAVSAIIMRSLKSAMEESQALNELLQPSFQADPYGTRTINHFLQGYYDLVIPGSNENSLRGVLLTPVDIQTFERTIQQRRLDVNETPLQRATSDPILNALLKANVDVLHRNEIKAYENLEIAAISDDEHSTCTVKDQDGKPHILIARNKDFEGTSEPGWESFLRDNASKLHRLPIGDEGQLLSSLQLTGQLRVHSEHLPALKDSLFEADPTGLATSVEFLQAVIDYEAESDSATRSEDSAMGGEEAEVLVHAVSQSTFMDACTKNTIDTDADVWLTTSPVLAGLLRAHNRVSHQVDLKFTRPTSGEMDGQDV